jgi:excisionase family DNA binding protein
MKKPSSPDYETKVHEPPSLKAEPWSSLPLGRDRLLTIREAAELTGLAVGTLYHFVSAKRIPVVRLSRRCIRFRHSDLINWIERLTEKEI